MNLLLDTHTFLWMSLDDPQLSEAARAQLSDTGNELHLSPVSYWEIAIKVSIGKYTVAEPLADLFERAIVANSLRVLTIDVAHAVVLSELPFHHRDPFDRLLIAQSIVEDLPIVGRDTIFDNYGVERIW
jgi:PIN domain nuclease of toxin-antitoxin system